MKILCIVDKYHPNASANTICCDNLSDCFKGMGHIVDILTIKNSESEAYCEEINGSKVIRFETYHSKYLKKQGKKYNAKVWSEFPCFFRKSRAVFNKLIHFYRPSTGVASLDCVDYKVIYKQVDKMGGKYDCIISLSMPFALHIIAKKLVEMGSSSKWFPVFLDAFEYNKCFSKLNIKYRKRLAQKVLKSANTVFLADGILNEYKEKDYYPEYHKKSREILIPTLKDLGIKHEIVSGEGKKILMTYAGFFYSDIRNPSVMLDVLSHFPNDFKIQLFGEGCESIIKNKMPKFCEGQLVTMGKIGHDKCINELCKSNILINLGNTITNQMPSKILEYISLGMPIINFYFTEDDMCLKVFKKYKLAYNFNLNNFTQDSVESLIKFCYENKNMRLSYDDATAELCEYRV